MDALTRSQEGPQISYDNGVSSIRISSKDLPSVPRRSELQHVIKSSTIPSSERETSHTSVVESGGNSGRVSGLNAVEPVIGEGPVTGSVRVSTLDRPKGIKTPSTYQSPDHCGSSTSLTSIGIKSDIPSDNQTEMETSATSRIPTTKQNGSIRPTDMNGNIPKDTGGSLPVLTEENEHKDDDNATTDVDVHNTGEPKKVVPAPSALRRSSEESRHKNAARKVSWNESVVVTQPDTDDIDTVELQTEDHEYAPCDGGKIVANGQITTDSGTEVPEDVLKEFGFLNDEPMFTYSASSRTSRVLTVGLLVLFLLSLTLAVILGILYGISITSNYDAQIATLVAHLSLTAAAGSAPFPQAFTRTEAVMSYHLVLGGQQMPSQKPSSPVLLSWIKGKTLQVVSDDGAGTRTSYQLGDPLESDSNLPSLILDTSVWYSATLSQAHAYCLLSITPTAESAVTWSSGTQR